MIQWEGVNENGIGDKKTCLNGKVIGSIRRTGLVTVLVNILLHTSTHTAFRKAVTSLETDLSDILTDLFGFFKHTTARRADQTS